MSKYKISTDEVIIQAIKEGKELGYVNPITKIAKIGIPTSCDVINRKVVLQFPEGYKETFSFDNVLVPQ